jgi:hypothetical protein
MTWVARTSRWMSAAPLSRRALRTHGCRHWLDLVVLNAGRGSKQRGPPILRRLSFPSLLSPRRCILAWCRNCSALFVPISLPPYVCGATRNGSGFRVVRGANRET